MAPWRRRTEEAAMTSSLRPLPASAVVQALATLPSIRSNDSGLLDAARTALARAIASGQDAGELGQALSAQSAWLGVDLRGGGAHPVPAAAQAAKVPQPPEWPVSVAQAAVQAPAALRVAVLDRNPSTVSTLGLPAWAIGQRAAATYGPLLVESPDSQLTVQKWFKVYIVPVQMVSFVQGSTTLFVAPFAATGSAQTITLAAGSVWINVASFASGAPSDSFGGIAIQGGTITSDQPLTLGGSTVTVPAGASLTLTVTPAAPTGTGNAGSIVTPPTSRTFDFPSAGAATATLADFSATLYGQTFQCTQSSQPVEYYDIVKALTFPFTTNQTQFAPGAVPNTMLSLQGSAPIGAVGWALHVAQSAPAQLGNAAGAGLAYLRFNTGISGGWPGLRRP